MSFLFKKTEINVYMLQGIAEIRHFLNPQAFEENPELHRQLGKTHAFMAMPRQLGKFEY